MQSKAHRFELVQPHTGGTVEQKFSRDKCKDVKPLCTALSQTQSGVYPAIARMIPPEQKACNVCSNFSGFPISGPYSGSKACTWCNNHFHRSSRQVLAIDSNDSPKVFAIRAQCAATHSGPSELGLSTADLQAGQGSGYQGKSPKHYPCQIGTTTPAKLAPRTGY